MGGDNLVQLVESRLRRISAGNISFLFPSVTRRSDEGTRHTTHMADWISYYVSADGNNIFASTKPSLCRYNRSILCDNRCFHWRPYRLYSPQDISKNRTGGFSAAVQSIFSILGT